jgi:transposase
VQVLKEPGRKAQSKSYMWVQMTDGSGPTGAGPPIRLFAYSPSRSTQTARTLYEGMRSGGVLMSDGYEPYAAVAEQHRLVHLGCWAHCRRYFHEALQALPKDKRGPEQLAARFIALIGKLYHVESEARREELDAMALQRRRQSESAPVLEQIKELALRHLHGVLPGSLLGKALHYVTAQWARLVRYIDDGTYPIDNNVCENAIRPFVVGRRNWLFADTVAGANASANLYSLLQTCIANKIDGYRYLKALFVELPKANTVEDFEALMPWRIAIDRQ